jgi:hypothetical protein
MRYPEPLSRRSIATSLHLFRRCLMILEKVKDERKRGQGERDLYSQSPYVLFCCLFGKLGEYVVGTFDEGFHPFCIKAFLRHQRQIIDMLTNHVC